MKSTKTVAMGALVAAFALTVGSAFAADTAPAAPKDVHAKCEQQAKDKKLTGEAATAAVKKCEADAAAAAKKK